MANKRLIGWVFLCSVPLCRASPSFATLTGVYTLNGGTDSQTGQTYSASSADQSAVFVYNGGNLTLSNATLTESGTASNTTNNYQDSSQFGNNAAVLAGTGASTYNGTSTTTGVITITGNTSVTTSANGNNGLYATSTGSSISMTGGTIKTSGTFSHGVDATYAGSITLNGTTITTSGSSGSAGMSTDFGGGTVMATNVNVTTAGSGSPAIYSTGTISATGSTLKATGGWGSIIDGGNTINLTNSSLTSLTAGVRVFRSAPGTTAATVTIIGGSVTSTAGDGLFVDGSVNAAIANFTLQGGVTVNAASGVLLRATSTGANTTNAATLTANGETLSGNLVTDSYSTISATLQNNTTLTGSINSAATGADNLTVAATSKWVGMGGSVVAALTNSGTIASKSNTPGLLTITSSYGQSSTGALDILLGGTTAGSTYDQLAVAGSATLGGVLDVNSSNGFTPSVGQSFTILTRGSGSGSFSSLTSDTGLGYTASYGANSVQITVTSVPEPTAGIMLVGGLLTMLGRRRRRPTTLMTLPKLGGWGV